MIPCNGGPVDTKYLALSVPSPRVSSRVFAMIAGLGSRDFKKAPSVFFNDTARLYLGIGPPLLSLTPFDVGLGNSNSDSGS